ncbi:hypothetical protein [Streptomyces sp. NPDC052036]|uniref:hypothetical protein n=1 Tax=Streptomyces sp. NPDC052036 TaxID=3155171 RepID=UPI0034397260
MTRPILEKIAGRETAVSVEAERLRAEIAQLCDRLREIEHELAELATVRKVVLALDGDESAPTHPAPPDNPVYQHILSALADAETRRRAREWCQAPDLGGEAKHIEGIWAKLRRLVGLGPVTETASGLFTLRRQ